MGMKMVMTRDGVHKMLLPAPGTVEMLSPNASS